MKKGFTLVELIVTISIFVVITALIVVRYSRFNSGTILTNTAYEMALTIHQAQTFGISVVSNQVTTTNFAASYGIEFDLTNPAQYIMYYDPSNFAYYFASSSVESNSPYNTNPTYNIIGTYGFRNNAKIVAICIDDLMTCTTAESQYSWYTSKYKVDSNVVKIDMQFLNGDPDPIIFKKYSNNYWYGPFSGVRIILASGDGTTQRVLHLTNVGQISVDLQ